MFKLSPSDFAFLWEDCKRCFYLKSIHKIPQPSMPLPGIFTKISSLIGQFALSKRTEDIHSALPKGTVEYQERFLQSVPISAKNGKASCFISGRFDAVSRFDDGTYGVIDFKTGNPQGRGANKYWRQIHAYAHAMENAANGKFSATPVTKLGLLFFYPSSIDSHQRDSVDYHAEVEWVEVPREDDKFFAFIEEVLSVLTSPIPTAQTCDQCDHCKAGLSCRPSKPCEKCPCICCPWCIYREGFVSGKILSVSTTEEVLCPQCGSPMAERNGKYGKFWGCTKYPECRGTINF